ncbi:amidohydrolase family protein [Edaphobacter bradus]|uniref:amidohydrolase family protein n=1 Tax=Edaphobacter bradus TaxID=2259016 RepID=UPI0021E0AB8F|nr:amidohydrolase family protein [Edaphobacter bradus]
MLIIDTHAHIYAENDAEYPAIDNPTRPPGKSGSLKTLDALISTNHVSAACAIQPISFYGWNNSFIRDVSSTKPKHLAGVCALDPDDTSASELLTRYVTEDGVRGLRTYVGSGSQLDHPGVRALWRAAEQLGIVVNVSVGCDKADDLARMLEAFPNLPVVIDHCLLPKAGPDLSETIAAMVRLAQFSNAYAKLSFLPLGSREEYPYRDMHQPCMTIIAAYSPERCVWGNCFPCELWSPKSDYSQNLRLFTHALNLQASARASILGRTAHALWFGEIRRGLHNYTPRILARSPR